MRIPIALALVLFSCSQRTDEELFRKLVYSDTDVGITNFRTDRLGCMHCPTYFRFKSTREIQRKIIGFHGLTEVGTVPEVVSDLDRIIVADMDWWDIDPEVEETRVFRVNYVPLDPTGEVSTGR